MKLPTVHINPRIQKFMTVAPASPPDTSLQQVKRPKRIRPGVLEQNAQHRDEQGFRIRYQTLQKHKITSFEQLGGQDGGHDKLEPDKTIHEEEAEGAQYVIDGRLRRVSPYYFTYLTYCKLRWRDRTLLDIFVNEFRDRDEAYYRSSIAAGLVTLNKKVASLDTIVRNGDLISHRCFRREPPISSREIKIVFENDEIIAIDKPSGIPVHPAGRYRYNTITKIFQHELGQIVHPCNRLDRLTSGLMFLGKSSKGTEAMVSQIRERSVVKEYIARVKGKFPVGDLVVENPLLTISPMHTLNIVDKDGKDAKTLFKRVSYDPITDTSVVVCRPHTGRSHQIRVHLQFVGHPIANDPIYSNPYVWGPELGKNFDKTDLDGIILRLDEIGKTRGASSWIHPNEDGEVFSGEKCPTSGLDLYSDPGPNDLDLWLHAYRYAAADLLWSHKTAYPNWATEASRRFMEMAISEAAKCGETQTQFNVGAVLVNDGQVLSLGHSRELPGNTHAEQCALEKYFTETGERIVPPGTEIYTTMEPCTYRLSGNLPCADRILDSNITSCFVGISEPQTFVKDNVSANLLKEKGIEYIHIPGYEPECLRIATKGHDKIGTIAAAESPATIDEVKLEPIQKVNPERQGV